MALPGLFAIARSAAASARTAASAVGNAISGAASALERAAFRRNALSVRTRVEWGGKAKEDAIKREAANRMTRVVDVLRKKVVHNLTQNRVIYSPSGAIRSKPGEYPYRDTGTLASSIRGQVFVTQRAVRGSVFTDVPYGDILERKMKRSFLKRTFNESKPQLEKILGAPMKGVSKRPKKQ